MSWLKKRLKIEKFTVKHCLFGSFIVLMVIVALFLIFTNFFKYDTVDKKADDEFLVPLASASPEDDDTMIYVHVKGAVKNPGVYPIQKDSRVFDVLHAAGGTTVDADLTEINLARKVTDEEELYVQSKPEGLSTEITLQRTLTVGITKKVNINTASATELDQLPKIGPVLSERIVTYRNTNGKFRSIEEIKNVDGIGEGIFNSIKDYIVV